MRINNNDKILGEKISSDLCVNLWRRIPLHYSVRFKVEGGVIYTVWWRLTLIIWDNIWSTRFLLLPQFWCCDFSEKKKEIFTISLFVIDLNMSWNLKIFWSVRGQVVRVNDLESLAYHRQGLWILSYVDAIQLVNGTSVVLLRCPLVPEIMHGGAPKCWCDVKPNKKEFSFLIIRNKLYHIF